jgi:energy-coupling factor transporter ATP-binding protein EcfA2
LSTLDSQQSSAISISVTELAFSDGSEVEVGPNDIVIIVGPNNSGKSATLRAISEKLEEPASPSPVLKALKTTKRGTPQELLEWIVGWAKMDSRRPQDPIYRGHGHAMTRAAIMAGWQRPDSAIGPIQKWLCKFLSADARLGIGDPAQAVALTEEAPKEPIHYLQRDDELERRLSARFRKAFGADLIVHRNAGAKVPLHVGERPVLLAGEDRVSVNYIKRLEALPQLQTQGDGMRSFAGVLLACTVGSESVLLIDEPEAFLHPPQAKLLGAFLMERGTSNKQQFIATHSADFLRGILESRDSRTKVIRIRRDGNTNHVRLLDNARVAELWGDPLLRYSNILDGLFHEGVVVCEGDADCRFYSAVLDASLNAELPDEKKPDLMFTHCGGKARMPLVVRSLKEVDVPVRAVADFDILSEEQPLRDLVQALGGDWSLVEADWRIVKSAIDARKPELSSADVSSEIRRVLEPIKVATLPESARLAIQAIVRRSSAWSNAKLVGKSYVPSGDASQACERLLATLRQTNLNVVDVGELEGFCRTVGGHGPKWVNAVLTRDLASDPELMPSRDFVKGLLFSS